MMTTTTKLKWTDSGYNAIANLAAANPDLRFLGVDDDHICSLTTLLPGMSVDQALADYARGYEASEPDMIRVCWRLYEGGKEVEHGTDSFEVDQ